jgi:hypothetical protein
MREIIEKIYKKRGLPKIYQGCKNWIEMTEIAINQNLYPDFYLPNHIGSFDRNFDEQKIKNIYVNTLVLESFAADYNHLLSFSQIYEGNAKNKAREIMLHYLENILNCLHVKKHFILKKDGSINVFLIDIIMKDKYSEYFEAVPKKKGKLNLIKYEDES